VVLTRVDGHAFWANSRALDLAHVEAATPDPPGGRIHRDEQGRPTGVLVDAAMDLVRHVMPEPPREEKRRAILRAAAAMAEAGLTGAHDMGMSVDEEALYRELARAGELPVRVYGALSAGRSLFTDAQDASPEEAAFRARLARGPDREWDGTFKLGMVKFYVDGALGSRGAALLEPYSDEPGNRGLLILEPDSLRHGLERAAGAGFQCAVHAIGDRANRVVLDVWESLGRTDGLRPVPPFPPASFGTRPPVQPAWRLEHAQVLHPDDVGRLGALGAVASMQPTHCTSDMPWAPVRLGPERLAGAYAWRSVVDAGALLAAGSDFPVESHLPVLTLHAAATRGALSGGPAGGWSPGERLSREEALAAMTAAPAYVSGDLHRLGTLSTGKLADFVVFDRNLATCDAQDLLEARALLTVVAGRTVWRHPRAAVGAGAETEAR
jgi:predicted amidohydrolase YtcJ